jgi:hypothetical protein
MRKVFASCAPPDPDAINSMMQLVITGVFFGFVVKGEIALDGDVGVINNLAG